MVNNTAQDKHGKERMEKDELKKRCVLPLSEVLG